MTSKQIAKFAAKIALGKKALDVTLIDMRKVSGFCDYFLIMGAESTRKVHAIYDGMCKGMADKKIKIAHVEGEREDLWILVDLVDVVIHVFYHETRKFYNLERLWQDAPQEIITDQCQKSSRSKKKSPAR